MCGFRRRLLRGSWLQLVVLRVLYENPTHGYKTILRRMEHSGLLTSIWEKKSAGLDRRIYNLTDEGVEMLRQGKSMIEGQRKVLEEMAEFYRLHFKDDYDE